MPHGPFKRVVASPLSQSRIRIGDINELQQAMEATPTETEVNLELAKRLIAQLVNPLRGHVLTFDGARFRNRQAAEVAFEDYKPVGGNVETPLSSRYGTLAAAQVDYPYATALTEDVNTAALRHAFHDAKERGKGAILTAGTGGVVVFGTDRWTGIEGLTVPYKVGMRGVFCQAFTDRSGAGFDFGSILSHKIGSVVPMLIFDDTTGPVRGTSIIGGGDQHFQNTSIQWMGFHGNRSSELPEGSVTPALWRERMNADLIRIVHQWDITIDQCYMVNAKGFGIRALDCNTLQLRDIQFVGTPIYFESLADSHMIGCSGGGAHGRTSPVVWYAGPGQECWANISSQNIIFNSAAAAKCVVTADPVSNVFTSTTPLQWPTDTPIIVKTTGTRPGGTIGGRAYYLSVLSDTTFKLATTRKNRADGATMDITSAGTGTHTIQCGEDAVLYICDPTYSKWNLFLGNRYDQGHADNVVVDGAPGNVFADSLNYGAGLGNATGMAGFRLINGSIGTVIDGGVTDGTVYTSAGIATNQAYGIYADDTSYGTRISPTTHVKNHATANVRLPNYSGEVEYLSLGVPDFEAMAGSPAITLAATSRRKIWQLDATADESIGTEFWFPLGWRTIRIHVHVVDTGAVGGDYCLAANVGSFGAGDNLNVADQAGTAVVTTTAAAQWIIQDVTLPDVTIAENKEVFLRILRDADNVLDTLANDIGILGVRIERVV